jgi:ABC-type Mn2+/Zn2+ transport system ATPase subunit
MCSPRLLFLDEWLESLDESASQRLIDMVKKMHGEGVSIIMVSHDIRIIKNLADEVVMVLEGRMCPKISKEQFSGNEDLLSYIEKSVTS